MPPREWAGHDGAQLQRGALGTAGDDGQQVGVEGAVAAQGRHEAVLVGDGHSSVGVLEGQRQGMAGSGGQVPHGEVQQAGVDCQQGVAAVGAPQALAQTVPLATAQGEAQTASQAAEHFCRQVIGIPRQQVA